MSRFHLRLLFLVVSKHKLQRTKHGSGVQTEQKQSVPPMKRLRRGDGKRKVRLSQEHLAVPFGMGDLPTSERRLEDDAATTTATNSKAPQSKRRSSHLCSEPGNGSLVPELFPDPLDPPDPPPSTMQTERQTESHVSVPGALAVSGPGEATASRQIVLNQEEGRSPRLNQEEEEQSQILLNAVLVDDNARPPPMPMVEAVAVDPDGNKKGRRIMMAVAVLVLLVTALVVVVVVVLVVVGGRQNNGSNVENTHPPLSPSTEEPVAPTDSSPPTQEPSVSPTILEPTASPTMALVQRLALVEFFSATNDATWNVGTNWNSETVHECDGWHGVSCANGLVTGIALGM